MKERPGKERSTVMCLQCGCGLPYDDMGEPDKTSSLTTSRKPSDQKLSKASQPDEAIKNIVETWKKDKQYKSDD